LLAFVHVLQLDSVHLDSILAKRDALVILNVSLQFIQFVKVNLSGITKCTEVIFSGVLVSLLSRVPLVTAGRINWFSFLFWKGGVSARLGKMLANSGRSKKQAHNEKAHESSQVTGLMPRGSGIIAQLVRQHRNNICLRLLCCRVIFHLHLFGPLVCQQ
jgi:hypothetical protein